MITITETRKVRTSEEVRTLSRPVNIFLAYCYGGNSNRRIRRSPIHPQLCPAHSSARKTGKVLRKRLSGLRRMRSSDQAQTPAVISQGRTVHVVDPPAHSSSAFRHLFPLVTSVLVFRAEHRVNLCCAFHRLVDAAGIGQGFVVERGNEQGGAWGDHGQYLVPIEWKIAALDGPAELG